MSYTYLERGNMAKPLFVAIGVHNARWLEPLDGVLQSITTLIAWAKRRGYDTVQVDDRKTKVTIKRLRDKLRPEKLLDRPRIVIYFCGHGLHAPQDQYWVLSAGPDQQRERISLIGFRDTLATYGPKQIAMFSDACRTPRAVTGGGDNVIDAYEGARSPVEKDNFFSAIEGAPSYAVPAKDGKPAYCVFSRTVSEALNAEQASLDFVDPIYFRTGRDVITSQSLATYLEKAVPRQALAVGMLQPPVCDPGFRPLENIYVEFAKRTSAGEPTLRGPDGSPLGPGDLAERVSIHKRDRRDQRRKASRSEWRGPLIEKIGNIIRSVYPRYAGDYIFLDGMVDPVLVQELPAQGRLAQVLYGQQRLYVHRFSREPTKQSDIWIAQDGEFFAPIVTFKRLWCAVAFRGTEFTSEHTISPRGVELLSWGRFESDTVKSDIDAVEALKGLSIGVVTSDDIHWLVPILRERKHADPMFGIVAAYLYDAVGDVDNIRRMCYYYYQFGQDVPFDIAVLAGLELRADGSNRFHVNVPAVNEVPSSVRDPDLPDYTWERTPECSVEVGGLTPILRAGWQFLFSSPHRIHQQCLELVNDLSNSPISTFKGKQTGEQLIKIFKAHRSGH